ncbi:myogenesis-regulating glycosidase [Sitodiplosis mosellana]|uniref:myogenesis-regulating glycosidase n=1 Tax=Sitodiplosis mosellana TaxID=263140 RepID=UPI002444038D|nr:myogenesis-regulating glycosidase [Sitodiplosis mosellana]
MNRSEAFNSSFGVRSYSQPHQTIISMGKSKIVLFLFIVLSTVCLSKQQTIVDSDYKYVYTLGNFAIQVDNTAQNTVYTVQKFGRQIQRVHLNADFEKNLTRTETADGFVLHGLDRDVEFKVIEDSDDFTLVKVSSLLKRNQRDSHCFNLYTGRMNWFGGPQIFYQYWPVEKFRFQDYSYVPKQQDNVGVAERYWLNSEGGFIYVDDKVPLFLDQNVNSNQLCFLVKNELPYNTRRESIDFVYTLGFGNDAKDAQRKAVAKFLEKPTAVADRRMVEHPIWSTWARYKAPIDEKTVEEFASEIERYGFSNSQLEIDDDWEICYGALSFGSKFPNIRNQTDGLRARGFRVTLWIHPFINKGCEPWYTEAKDKGYLVTNYEGNPDTEWWNSVANDSAYIDFTKFEAAEWYQNRLKKLQEDAGIDSFKFDAGETSWLPKDPKLNTDLDDHPLAITKAYIRAVSKFGPIVEVRSGQGTQDLPIFVRFIDKDSEWTYRNGLPTLITSLLQMNIVGYGFILPDMIGGNGYKGAPSEELFLRWLQANVFMPSLQYSYVPWDYSEEAIKISKKFTNLHAQYTDDIMAAFEKAVISGEPVNPPIWWIDPKDKVALGISDEFLLGDRILAAPVINKGEDFRDVYLPKGNWFDPNQNKTHAGPIWLMEYPAPIDVLPYFIREKP